MQVNKKRGYWFGKKKPQSEDTKKKISRTLMGHKISEKVRKTLAEKTPFKKGHIPWNKGKNWPEEMKKRISETNKNKKIEPTVKFIGFGVNHPRWKGGIGSENNRIRGRIEFRLWRESVFARDNWTCQKTGVKGGKLNSNHIKNFSQYPELRFAIDNGITLSDNSHREFHKKYGTRNNTEKQIEEFLKQ